mmetsp:Transcript_34352/g.86402  ORF Transcript_34352/g.86402 Transcript_34352/m.86402 type:complete len:97 (-) Transcript_34352:624-914(-)
MLLLGDRNPSHPSLSMVQLVDLAPGACTSQPNLLRSRAYPAAARLPDGRIVSAGGTGGESSAMCGARRSTRERRTPHGPGQSCPSDLQLVFAAVDA